METMSQVRQKASAPAEAVRPVMSAADAEADALGAARALGAALAETSEYLAFEQARLGMRDDADAQKAIRAFREKQVGLSWKLQMGLISDTEREELDQLQQAMFAQPAVQAFMDAQRGLARLCSEASEIVSDTIGLGFAASCGPGCSCG